MAYSTTKFDAQFMFLVLSRVQTVLERDANTAVAEWADTSLEPFLEFQTPLEIVTRFPALYVAPVSTKADQAQDDLSIKSAHQIAVGVAVVGETHEIVKTRMIKYLVAIDRVLRTMTISDLMDGVSQAKGEPAWEVTEHQYGLLYQEAGAYRRDASLTLEIHIRET